MSKRTLLFAPCAFNLAETSRMVEIAKASAPSRGQPGLSSAFHLRWRRLRADDRKTRFCADPHGAPPHPGEDRVHRQSRPRREVCPGLHRCRADRSASTTRLPASRRLSPPRPSPGPIDHPGQLPGSSNSPGLGRAIDLAAGILLPRRGHDGPRQARSGESRSPTGRFCGSSTSGSGTDFSTPSTAPQDTSAFQAMIRSSNSGAATSRWSRSRPNFPGSHCRRSTISSARSSPWTSFRCRPRSPPFRGTSR